MMPQQQTESSRIIASLRKRQAELDDKKIGPHRGVRFQVLSDDVKNTLTHIVSETYAQVFQLANATTEEVQQICEALIAFYQALRRKIKQVNGSREENLHRVSLVSPDYIVASTKLSPLPVDAFRIMIRSIAMMQLTKKSARAALLVPNKADEKKVIHELLQYGLKLSLDQIQYVKSLFEDFNTQAIIQFSGFPLEEFFNRFSVAHDDVSFLAEYYFQKLLSGENASASVTAYLKTEALQRAFIALLQEKCARLDNKVHRMHISSHCVHDALSHHWPMTPQTLDTFISAWNQDDHQHLSLFSKLLAKESVLEEKQRELISTLFLPLNHETRFEGFFTLFSTAHLNLATQLLFETINTRLSDAQKAQCVDFILKKMVSYTEDKFFLIRSLFIQGFTLTETQCDALIDAHRDMDMTCLFWSREGSIEWTNKAARQRCFDVLFKHEKFKQCLLRRDQQRVREDVEFLLSDENKHATLKHYYTVLSRQLKATSTAIDVLKTQEIQASPTEEEDRAKMAGAVLNIVLGVGSSFLGAVAEQSIAYLGEKQGTRRREQEHENKRQFYGAEKTSACIVDTTACRLIRIAVLQNKTACLLDPEKDAQIINETIIRHQDNLPTTRSGKIDLCVNSIFQNQQRCDLFDTNIQSLLDHTVDNTRSTRDAVYASILSYRTQFRRSLGIFHGGQASMQACQALDDKVRGERSTKDEDILLFVQEVLRGEKIKSGFRQASLTTQLADGLIASDLMKNNDFKHAYEQALANVKPAKYGCGFFGSNKHKEKCMAVKQALECYLTKTSAAPTALLQA